MDPGRIIETITRLITPVVDDLGLELVDVQFRRESRGWVLRVIIDSAAGIGIDDCTKVSREVSDLLDVEEDLIEAAYHLEVSSPGLNRPLKNAGDFRRCRGRKVRITTREPADPQPIVGKIDTVDDDRVGLTTDQGFVEIPYPRIVKARLEIEF